MVKEQIDGKREGSYKMLLWLREHIILIQTMVLSKWTASGGGSRKYYWHVCHNSWMELGCWSL